MYVLSTVFILFFAISLNVTSHNSDSLFCVVGPASGSTYPGEAPISILYLNIGIAHAIFRHANVSRGQRTDLQAVTSSSLCMVMRTSFWRPRKRDPDKIGYGGRFVAWKVIEGAWCKELPRSRP
jgi:hypothetical protein